MRDRMVAIDPDEADPWEDYPNNIRPGHSGYDEDAPIWGVWEQGPGSPPDGEWGWCPVGPFGLSAEEAEEERAKLDAEPYIPWPSFQELTEMVASESLDVGWFAKFQGQVLWEVNNPYRDVVGPFRKWDDETELIRYMALLDIDWDEDEGLAILEEQRPIEPDADLPAASGAAGA
jgi:hypothetical protein